MRRRAQALVMFVGYAAKLLSTASAGPASGGGALNDLVSLLINIITAPGTEKNLDDVATAARLAMGQVLTVMSAADFIRAVVVIVECGEDRVSQFRGYIKSAS